MKETNIKFPISQSSISLIVQSPTTLYPLLHDHLNKLNKQAKAFLNLQHNKSHVTRRKATALHCVPRPSNDRLHVAADAVSRFLVHFWYRILSSSFSLDLRTMKGEDRWQPVYIHRMEKKLPGTAQMHKYIEENAHVPRTMGQSRAEGDPPLDTSASHFFFDNGRKKASHVYLDEVRQSRWLEWTVVVQITDVSQTKWIEEGWFRFDSKREWELYGSSLREREREYLLFFYYRLDFLC